MMFDGVVDGVKQVLVEKADIPCAACGSDENVQAMELLPLDPIDHGKQFAPICEGCRDWAIERNELAREVGYRLRDKRAELAEEYAEEIDELAEPPGGFEHHPESDEVRLE